MVSFFLLSVQKSSAQPGDAFSLPVGKKAVRLPIIRSGSLIILKTYLNEKGPFNFVLDSGVDLMLITDPSLKDSLNLDYIRRIEIGGLGEQKELVAFVTPGIHVKIGKIEAKRLGAVILQDQQTNLSAYAGIPIHGLIGFDFLIVLRLKLQSNTVISSVVTKLINYQKKETSVYRCL